ncbi:MAG: hypothetical protein NT106_07300 [Candidatus Sumerlaeota bacterium]|nr:hypothetical protein [Candidatus Sumerlaeota bacterium]
MIDLSNEASLLPPVLAYIKRKGFNMHAFELHFYKRSVDIYAFSKNSYRTIAIELKLHKWQKAFEQALIYQLCADEAYIAMPKKFTNRVDFELLMKHGVGLISVNEIGRCRRLIDARQSSVLRIGYKNEHIDFLQRQING